MTVACPTVQMSSFSRGRKPISRRYSVLHWTHTTCTHLLLLVWNYHASSGSQGKFEANFLHINTLAAASTAAAVDWVTSHGGVNCMTFFMTRIGTDISGFSFQRFNENRSGFRCPKSNKCYHFADIWPLILVYLVWHLFSWFIDLGRQKQLRSMGPNGS